jgi:hypothetical protein
MTTLNRATAQITFYLDPNSGEIRAEMPSPNGSRRKIKLPDWPDRWGEIIETELLELDSWFRHQEERKKEQEKEIEVVALEAKAKFNRALHRKVYDTSASRRGQGVDFADKKFGSRSDPNIRPLDIANILAED